MLHRKNLLLTIGLGLPLLVGGCPELTNNPSTSNDQKGPPLLKRFDSSAALLEYFKQQASKQFSNQNQYYGMRNALGFEATPMAANDTAGAPTSGDGGGAGNEASSSTSFTSTNLQEEGVDEADIFKSDGTNFYIVRGRSLRILRATPPDEMAEIGRILVDDQIQNMYLADGKVLLLSSKYGFFGYGGGREMPVMDAMIWPPFYSNGALVIYDINVSDPANPTLTKKVDLDGSLVDSRIIGDRLLVVISIAPQLPSTQLGINLMTLDQVMPKRHGSDGLEQDLMSWQDFYRPGASDGYYMSAVVSIDVGDIDNVSHSTAVISNASTIYASPTGLYVTDSDYDPDQNYREKTAIHKFAIGEDGSARYVASGAVDGRPLNQFSLSEYNGFLRIATHVAQNGFVIMEPGGAAVGVAFADDNTSTVVDSDVAVSNDGSTDTSPPSDGDGSSGGGTGGTGVLPQQPFNAISVLAQSGDTLNVVGSVGNIAPGERIYSARYIANKLFLVTFRQIDPLFVIDLTDAAHPAVVGELKVPGFSDYLHPLDETHLIGVGRSIFDMGGFQEPGGLQLSLFDISDLTHPTAVQQITVGGPFSSSDVSYTHKAFALTEDGVLAIPASLNKEISNPNEWWTGPDFDGVLFYQVSGAGFTALGRLASVTQTNGFDYYGYPMWRRPAVIGDTAYAITDQGVRAAPLADLNASTAIELVAGEGDYVYGGIDGTKSSDGDAGVSDGSAGESSPGYAAP